MVALYGTRVLLKGLSTTLLSLLRIRSSYGPGLALRRTHLSSGSIHVSGPNWVRVNNPVAVVHFFIRQPDCLVHFTESNDADSISDEYQDDPQVFRSMHLLLGNGMTIHVPGYYTL